jgi:hypothetical protein
LLTIMLTDTLNAIRRKDRNPKAENCPLFDWRCSWKT